MAFTDQTTGGRVIRQGLMPIRITLTDTCHVGDLIGYDGVTSDTWVRADADGKIPASLVAGEKCDTSGDEIICYKMAYVLYPSTTSAVTGDMVYLANTAGQYAATPGSWVAQGVGEMVSTTEMYIHPTCQSLHSYATTGTGWGGYIRAELKALRTSMALWGGLRIDVKAIDTSVISSDAYGLYIFMQLQEAPAASSALLRLEDGCAASCGADSYIAFVTGTGDPPDYLFDLASVAEPTNGAWSCGTAANATPTGRIKVKTAAGTRYIGLSST